MFNQCNAKRVSSLSIVLFVLLTGSGNGLWAQEAKGTQAARRTAGRRLPPHYARVVTPQQREQIYEIQSKHAEKIEALEAQLAVLREARDKEIVAVLDEAQRAKVAELVAAAKARRQAVRAALANSRTSDPVPAKTPAARKPAPPGK